MTNDLHPVKPPANGGYEHQDIGVSGVLYFLLGLALSGLFVYFVVNGIYSFLEKHSEANQTPVSPLVTNAPTDTRKLPSDYKDYLQQNFPSPQLEIDERSQLDKIRNGEAETLSTYDWVDQKAGTVRIPIDRAMDLIAQRGLPVHAQTATEESGQPSKPAPEKKKAKK